MPEHKKKGVIHDKITYKNEEVYIVDPTGTYNPIQHHVVRQHEIYNYVSQKTLEDFNYNLALNLANEEDDERKQHQQRKHAKRQHKMEEYNRPSQSSDSRLGCRREGSHSEEQAIHAAPKREAWDQDLENQLIFDSTRKHPASSNKERGSNHHSRKRLKLQQGERQEVIDLVGSDDDLDVINVKARKQSEQPSLSAAFRSSQRSHHQASDDEDTSMGETVQVDTSEKPLTKRPIKAARAGRVDHISTSERLERKNVIPQIIEDDEDELNTIESNRQNRRPLVATTPKKIQGIFQSSPSTPGTGRSRKSLHELVVTPVLERREREQSRQSASLESPSRNRSARLSRSPSKDPPFDGVYRTSRRSAKISSQSRAFSPSAQVLPQSTKPDIFVRSSSPNPFVTSKNRAEDATKMEKKDIKAKEAKQLKKNEKNRKKKEQQKAAAILAAQAVEEPLPSDEEQEYEIKGLLGDKMLKKNGKRIRYFLVDWKGPYDPTWEPAGNIDDHVRDEYFRIKIMADSGDEAQSSHSLGLDGAMDTKSVDHNKSMQYYTDDMDIQTAIRDENEDIEMEDVVTEDKFIGMENRDDKHGTAKFKRDLPSLVHRKKSVSVKSPNAFPTTHQLSASPGLAGNGQKLRPSSSKKGYGRTIDVISESEADQYPAQLFDPNFDQDVGASSERLKSRGTLSRKVFPKAAKNKSVINLVAGEDDRVEGTPVVGELADDEESDIDLDMR